MQLTGNLSINRFEWAALTAKGLIDQYHQQKKPVYYDVGAGPNTLVKTIGTETRENYSFDLFPANNEVKQWDIQEPFPYDCPPADFVTFLEIVEHLNNPWLCIKNLAAVMAPGAHLILSTPNPGWSSSRVNLLFKGFLTCFTESDLRLNHHVFTAWPHILEKLLNDNGLEVVEYVTLDGPTELFDKALKASSSFVQLPARGIKKFIERRDPSSIGMSYGVLARKVGKTA
ncbi:hypothetical protein A0256_10495 [Mucilaginibacter sp. PAMC 26640]|nr:hypothetical protein A0256_10495 [Mucilaginibacter sp. PAMC 26640]